MLKYMSLFKYEMKTIVRDPINLYMVVFPFIILLLSSYVFPLIFRSMDQSEVATIKMTMLLILVVILAFGSFVLAAMASFLLLEHKDECTLNTIAVTPIGASGYLKFKMTYVYIMSVISTIIILGGTKLIAGDAYSIGGVSLFDNIKTQHIISFALVSGIFAPALALFQGAFAKNKVEGFAFIKGTGILILIPALMFLDAFQGGLQFILGIFPNFWVLKGIMLQLFPIENTANLSYPVYLIIGAVYNVLILLAFYRLFLRKTQY